MKEYQQRNDAKYQVFSKYRAQGNLTDLAKRDEEVMLRHIAEKEAKETNEI